MRPAAEKKDSLTDRRIHNRRRFARATVRWPVTIIHEDKTLSGRVKNISRGGLLVYLESELELHDAVRLAVEIPEYQDAITAEGVVLRVTRLKNLVEKRYAFAASIQFTDISDENLKYFSGNFAPEWHQNYPEEQVAMKQDDYQAEKTRWPYKRATFWGLILLCLLFLFFYLRPEGENNAQVASQLDGLNSRLDAMDKRIAELMDAADNNEQSADLETRISENGERLKTLGDELSRRDTRLADIEKRQQKILAEFSAVTSAITASNETPPSTITNQSPVKIKKTESSSGYYEVKKGENLYRISINHGLTIAELRALNNLSETDNIHPGQKLRVK